MREHSFVKFVPGVYVVYLSVPKVASSSISHSLLLKVPSVHEGIWEHSQAGKALTNRRSVELPFPKLPVFTFVRHPIDKFTSYYRDKFIGGRENGFELANLKRLQFDPFMTLDEMVSHMMTIPVEEMEHHAQPQHRILIKKGKLLPDFVGQFENISNLWPLISDLSLVNLSLGKQRNQSSKKENSLSLSDKALGALCQYYAVDFELFEYARPSFDVPGLSIPESLDHLDKQSILSFKKQIKNNNKKWRELTEKLADQKFRQNYLRDMQNHFNEYLLSEYQFSKKQLILD